MPGAARRDPGRAERPRAADGPPLRARHLDLEPGHDRRHVRQQLGRLPLDRLRQDDRPRARAQVPAGRRLGDRAPGSHAGRARGEVPGGRAGGADLPRGAAARDPARRRDPRPVPEAHAARLGLQPRRVREAPAVRPPPAGGRLRGDAGRRGRDEDAARPAPEVHGARRDPLRRSPGGPGVVGRAPGHGAVRGRGDRQDDPRPRPRRTSSSGRAWGSSRATRRPS